MKKYKTRLKNKRNYQKGILGNVFNYTILFLTLIFCITPLFWLGYTSIKPRMLAFSIPPVWFDFKPSLENYKQVFENSNLIKYFINSFVIVSASTIFAMIIGTFAAYSFARFKKRHMRYSLYLILMTNMIPPAVIILPLFIFSTKVGVYDSHFLMILIYIGFNLAFIIWLLRSFFIDIPSAIEESALIDGCSRFGIVIKIVLPLSRPALSSTAILAFIFAWNEYLIALVLTSSKAPTLPILASGLISAKGIMWGQMTATATIMSLPVVLLALFSQKYLIRGLTFGAVKG